MKSIIPLATDIMGTKIKSDDGDDIGVVQNIMIDPQNGTIIYLALCYADFMGKENREFAIPRELLTIKHGTNGSVYLEVDKGHLMDAQPVHSDQYPSEQIDNNDFCIYELVKEMPRFAKSYA